MTAPITIRLLGPFEALLGERPADMSGPKRRALVALLALRGGRVVAVDSIVDAVWGDEDLPADPANAVQHHVTRLRKALGPDALVVSPEGYALRGAEVDALRFEELLAEARSELRNGDARAAARATDAALALWRGRPLLGLPEAEWAAAERARLEALRLDVLEERFETMLALGEHETLVPELRAALETNPFRERLWRQLMLALYRAGRQADALDAFQDARRMLADELGLEPGPDLQRLQSAILAHDPDIAAVPVRQESRGNLPAAVSSFVGRVELLGEVERLVREQRLVTLTGPPGVGKSRIALEAARALEGEFAGGAWIVDLARAHAAVDIPRLAARVVEAGSSPATGDPLRRVVGRLRNREALLVLDDCGRVAEDARPLISAVLEECPRVHVLATSREVLRVPGEHLVVVPPLAVPPDGDEDGPECAEAVRLFVERARAVRPGFGGTTGELALVGRICRLLDGLPGAIELTAARMNVLGSREVLVSVERRLALLRDHRLSPEAAHSLSSLVGGSYDLLHADEKTLLHQLAVFRGGAGLSALLAMAERLELDQATVTVLLTTLTDKSIVTVSFPDGGARYDVLTTVREYALERLAECGELEETRLAHARYFAALADAAQIELRGSDWQAWTRRLVLDDDNLWAALTYAVDTSQSDIAMRLGALSWYFALAERVSEGRRFLERALSAASDAGPVEPRIDLHAYLCYFATEELDLDVAIEAGETGLALAATAAGSPESARLRAALSLAVAASGEDERAAALAEEAHAVSNAAGDEWGAAAAGVARAMIAVRAGDVTTTAAMAAETLRHAEAIAYDAFVLSAMLLEAWAASHRHDRDAADAAYRRAIEIARRTDFVDHASFALAGLGSNARAGGDLRGAEELIRQAVDVAEASGATWAAAHARVELARVVAEDGDADAAEALYRRVVEWSEAPRSRQAREGLFRALAGNPGVRALLALAELTGGSDEAGAARLRERALAVAEAERAAFEPTGQPAS